MEIQSRPARRHRYGWPLLAHVAAQAPSAGAAPLALVVVPTRELAEQVYRELKRFARGSPRGDVGVVAVFGGSGKYEMAKALGKPGADVVAATPGRMMELVAENAADLQDRCTFLVVDEADRMFELGFQDQLSSLAQRVRPGRQSVFCTATLPPRVEQLVRSALRGEQLVRVVVGGYESTRQLRANDNVAQKTAVLDAAQAKWPWLAQRIGAMAGKGRVVVFCGRRAAVDQLAASAPPRGFFFVLRERPAPLCFGPAPSSLSYSAPRVWSPSEYPRRAPRRRRPEDRRASDPRRRRADPAGRCSSRVSRRGSARSTATATRPSGAPCCPSSARRPEASWWPRTSPRAASTSGACGPS